MLKFLLKDYFNCSKTLRQQTSCSNTTAPLHISILSLKRDIFPWHHIPRQMSWPSWNYRVATKVTQLRAPLFSLLGLSQGHNLSTSCITVLTGTAVMSVDEDKLSRVKDEIEFRWDVCRHHLWKPRWAHIKDRLLGHCCGTIRFPVCEFNKSY
jgi:hypothetical protein